MYNKFQYHIFYMCPWTTHNLLELVFWCYMHTFKFEISDYSLAEMNDMAVNIYIWLYIEYTYQLELTVSKCIINVSISIFNLTNLCICVNIYENLQNICWKIWKLLARWLSDGVGIPHETYMTQTFNLANSEVNWSNGFFQPLRSKVFTQYWKGDNTHSSKWCVTTSRVDVSITASSPPSTNDW